MIAGPYFSKFAGVFLALILGLSGSVLAQENDGWTKGNEEYAAGHFHEAADLYEGLAKSGLTSAALFYNLGNARLRLNELGPAILNYERALALEPQHPEAASNLRLVREKARSLELRQNWIERWTAHITTSQFAIAATIAFWIAVFAFAGLWLPRRRSALLSVVVILSLVTLAATAYGLFAHEQGPNGRGLAIVLAKNTDARLATADNAGTVLTLPPGSEIKILQTRGDWIYALLPNDLRGWIPAKNAERVRL